MPEAKQPTPTTASRPAADSKNMLPPRERRRSPFERVFVRIVATCGVVGIGVVIAAILASSHTQGWIIGLVVSIVSVVLAAVLWSSRQL
jgi:protein-S-isoprenylcysteine O-methyltransferase Ste14